MASYAHSSLWRAVEEALAETVAQVGVNGLRKMMVGIRFPVANGYVYMTKGGGYMAFMKGKGVVPEFAALIYVTMVGSLSIEMYFISAVTANSKAAVAP